MQYTPLPTRIERRIQQELHPLVDQIIREEEEKESQVARLGSGKRVDHSNTEV